MNYLNPLDSAISYDSNGVLSLGGVDYTRQTDRSFLDTLVDGSTFPDSSYDDYIRDSEFGIYSNLDSAVGGQILFYNHEDTVWYRASIANTNLVSLDSVATQNGSRNLYGSIEFSHYVWHYPYKDSDGADVTYQSLPTSVFNNDAVFWNKQGKRFFYHSEPITLDSAHGFGPDQGHLLRLSRYEPVTVGADSTTYNEVLFTYDAFIPDSGISAPYDSAGGFKRLVVQTGVDFVLDSYAVDISDIEEDSFSGISIIRSAFLDYFKAKLPTVRGYTASDIRFLTEVNANGDRDSAGALTNLSSADSDRVADLFSKILHHGVFKMRGELEIYERDSYYDSGFDRALTAYPYKVYFEMIDSI